MVTSYIAAAVKAKVTLIEAGEWASDCLNYGCVPQAVIKSAKIAADQRHGENYGPENATPQFSFKSNGTCTK
ncbi:hypothetical protein P4S63_17595 [Pseudoalteromonas sp. B193]